MISCTSRHTPQFSQRGSFVRSLLLFVHKHCPCGKLHKKHTLELSFEIAISDKYHRNLLKQEKYFLMEEKDKFGQKYLFMCRSKGSAVCGFGYNYSPPTKRSSIVY